MDKEAALFAIRGMIRTLKDLSEPKAGQEPAVRANLEMVLGVRLLCEAFALAMDDTKKAHAELAFDKAHKCLFDLTQQSSKPGYSEYTWIAGGCMALAGAMKWLFFSKPPARPWK